MTKPPAWPPPPNLPEPLSAHDDFLIACIRSAPPKPPLIRLSLAKSLREETELDLRACWAFVNNFCDRHAILTGDLPGSLLAWVGLIPILLGLVTAITMAGTEFLLQRGHNSDTAFMNEAAVKAEQSHVEFLALCVLAVISVGALILKQWRDKKMHDLAAEAKAKFA